MTTTGESERKLDQAIESIFNLATGSLALSITFRGALAPDDARFKVLLSFAWISLALVPIAYVLLRLFESRTAGFWEDLADENEKRKEHGLPVERLKDVPAEVKRKRPPGCLIGRHG